MVVLRVWVLGEQPLRTRGKFCIACSHTITDTVLVDMALVAMTAMAAANEVVTRLLESLWKKLDNFSIVTNCSKRELRRDQAMGATVAITTR